VLRKTFAAGRDRGRTEFKLGGLKERGPQQKLRGAKGVSEVERIKKKRKRKKTTFTRLGISQDMDCTLEEDSQGDRDFLSTRPARQREKSKGLSETEE